MECCGKEVVTPYCPTCGKRFGVEAVLDSLVSFLHTHATQARAGVAAKMMRPTAGIATAQLEMRAKQIKRSCAVAEKWERWRDALQAMRNPPKADPGRGAMRRGEA